MKISKILASIICLPISLLPTKILLSAIDQTIRNKSRFLTHKNALKLILTIDNSIYKLEGKYAKAYGNGIHTKHKHTGYHDFFIKNIEKNFSVLDLGCGNGALAYDIAKNKKDCHITGIDLNKSNINYAKSNFKIENLKFLQGDIFDESIYSNNLFNIIILSNVLEHLDNRPQFLRSLSNKFRPEYFLIRVPLFERDWRVPLKKELGLEWRLDPTHLTEYTLESWLDEINQAGMKVIHQEFRWGEIWAKVSESND